MNAKHELSARSFANLSETMLSLVERTGGHRTSQSVVRDSENEVQKTFEKKLLTNAKSCDIVNELSLRRQQRTLKTEQYVKP